MLYKDYGGIEWFEDKPLIFLCRCIKNSLENELKIPKIIEKFVSQLNGNKSNLYSNDTFNSKRKMRTENEILKDYDLEE